MIINPSNTITDKHKHRVYKTYEQPFPFMVVENFYREFEIERMLREAEHLESTGKMILVPPVKLDVDKKKNRQIVLDEIYLDRDISHILKDTTQPYNDKFLTEELKRLSWFYDAWNQTNSDRTFISTYGDGDYYESHKDIAVISIMYWMWREPKTFEGGDLRFPKYDIDVPLKRNMLMIIPSSIEHQVTPITSGMGRWCVVKFLYITPSTYIVDNQSNIR